MFPPIPSDVEEEEAEDEFPLARKFSRHGANSGKHFTAFWKRCNPIAILSW